LAQLADEIKRAGNKDNVVRRGASERVVEGLFGVRDDGETRSVIAGHLRKLRGGDGARSARLRENHFGGERKKNSGDFIDGFIAERPVEQPNLPLREVLLEKDGEFARGLPYRTTRPRPVIGSTGLVADAWHWTWERYGAPQLVNRFLARANRHMTGLDWSVWIAVKMMVQASLRTHGGDYSAQAAGDYASGPNHVLPTGGAARFRGGLSVLDFVKLISVQKLSRPGLQRIGAAIELLATEEGLPAHAQSIRVRCGDAAVLARSGYA